jgi:hypothetical protein
MERLDVELTDKNYVTWRKLFACLLYSGLTVQRPDHPAAPGPLRLLLFVRTGPTTPQRPDHPAAPGPSRLLLFVRPGPTTPQRPDHSAAPWP